MCLVKMRTFAVERRQKYEESFNINVGRSREDCSRDISQSKRFPRWGIRYLGRITSRVVIILVIAARCETHGNELQYDKQKILCIFFIKVID